jgi:effector-binding domain-containing protein
LSVTFRPDRRVEGEKKPTSLTGDRIARRNRRRHITQVHALKFVHRGSYDGLDNTYEAITNFLDDKRLEAKDMFIEQYVTDPLTTNEENLAVNVFVMIK